MTPLADYESIDPEERMRRIGRLLCKAAILALARRDAEEEAMETRTGAGNPPATGQHPLTEEELDFLRYVRRAKGVAPREASRFWNVSRATAFRRLASLEKQGWIARKGATTATRYTITRQTLDCLTNPDSGGAE